MHRVTVILEETARHFGLTKAALLQRTHKRSIARPRQIAMWLARHHTSCSLPDIAARLGGFHHTSILYGIEKIDELQRTDPDIADALRAIGRACRDREDGAGESVARRAFVPIRNFSIGRRRVFAMAPLLLTQAEAAAVARMTHWSALAKAADV
ncbi:MAG TPA: helix-turn-helix domain-containing protein [Caulobacterales bacterium]|nr:helix-turn-helix domain-containing protein [Caulobacterales bacterium]